MERPYEDSDVVGHYRAEAIRLRWWESQEADLSAWRKNYMRTLELRTLNAKRTLRLNIQGDIERTRNEQPLLTTTVTS